MGYSGILRFFLWTTVIGTLLLQPRFVDAGPCAKRLKSFVKPGYAVVLVGLALTIENWLPRLVKLNDSHQVKAMIRREQRVWEAARTPAEVFEVISNRYIKQIPTRPLDEIPDHILSLGSAEEWGLVFKSEVSRYLIEEVGEDGSIIFNIHLDNSISDPLEIIRSMDVLAYLCQRFSQLSLWTSISGAGLSDFRQPLYALQKFSLQFSVLAKNARPDVLSADTLAKRTDLNHALVIGRLLVNPPHPFVGIGDRQRPKTFGLFWNWIYNLRDR